MRYFLRTSVILVVAAVVGCSDPSSATTRSRGERGDIHLQVTNDPNIEPAPGEQHFQLKWTDDPDTQDENFVGVMGTDPETGKPRFYSAEEWNRQSR